MVSCLISAALHCSIAQTTLLEQQSHAYQGCKCKTMKLTGQPGADRIQPNHGLHLTAALALICLVMN